MLFITCLKHYSLLNFQITLSISDCKTLYSFLACWISILILFLTWLNCWSRAWWELWSCASSWNEREDKHFLVWTHPTFRNIKHVKLIIFDSKTRPFDSLSLVLDFLLQRSMHAFSIMSLTVHLLCYLLQLHLKRWTLRSQINQRLTTIFTWFTLLFNQKTAQHTAYKIHTVVSGI